MKHISNEDLLLELKSLVSEERKITLRILNLINEVDSRRIYLELGYSSAFEWLVKDLGYSESAAMRRLNSAKLLKAAPEIGLKIESGALNITNLAKSQSVIRAEEKRTGEKLNHQSQAEIVKLVESKSSRAAEIELAAHFPEAGDESSKREKTRPIGPDVFKVQITLSRSQLAKLERVRELASHVNFGASLAEIVEILADEYLKRKDPLVREVKPKAQSKAQVTEKTCDTSEDLRETGKSSRTLTSCATGAGSEKSALNPLRKRRSIKPSVRNLIHRRALGQCEFVDPKTNCRCQSRFLTEVDHRKPVALGGGNEIENLRLLCRPHNSLMARRLLSPNKVGS